MSGKLARMLWLGAVIVGVLLIVAGCGKEATPTPRPPTATPTRLLATPTPAKKTGVITVGCVGPFTGSAASWGIDLKRGMTQFADEVKERGGLRVGDSYYTLDIQCFDGEFKTQGGVAAANNLVLEKGIKWVVGPVASPECLGWQQVAEPLKAMSIIPVGCWGEGIIGPDHPGTFRLGLSFREQGPVHAAWVKRNLPQVQTVAFVAAENITGRSSADQMKTAFEVAGFQTVSIEYFKPETVDFNPIVIGTLARKPDLLYAVVVPDAQQGLLWKQVWEQGYKGEKMGGVTNLVDGLKASDGPQPWENVYSIGTVPYCDPKASLASELKLCKALSDRYGETPSSYAFNGYAALQVLATLWQATGSVTDMSAAIAWWEAHPDTETVVGLHKLGGKTRYGIQRVTFGDIGTSVVRNGEVVPFFRGPAAYEP